MKSHQVTKLVLRHSTCPFHELNTNAAGIFLQKFFKEIVSIQDGNERCETINIHRLTHFVDQVKRFGPLFCYWAMSFEAANRTSGEVFTGAHSECEIICRRLLQRNKLATIQLEDDTLIPLYDKITGQQLFKVDKFDEEFIETEEVQFGRSLYPGAHFLNRQQLQDVYLDSPAYGRSKLGNCYVSFKRCRKRFLVKSYTLCGSHKHRFVLKHKLESKFGSH